MQKCEKSARNMQSLSRYSRSNSINREWIDQYLNEAHSLSLIHILSRNIAANWMVLSTTKRSALMGVKM